MSIGSILNHLWINSRSRASSEESEGSSKKTVFGLLKKSPKQEKKTFTEVISREACEFFLFSYFPNFLKVDNVNRVFNLFWVIFSFLQELLEKPDINEDVSPEQQEAYNLLVVKGAVRDKRDSSPSDSEHRSERHKQARERRIRRALEHQKQVSINLFY